MEYLKEIGIYQENEGKRIEKMDKFIVVDDCWSKIDAKTWEEFIEETEDLFSHNKIITVFIAY